MHKRLYFLVTKYNIIHPLRFGFQAHHSIDNTLISMIEVIENTLENNKYGCGVFVDLQKAFDSANHNILLSTRTLWYKRECSNTTLFNLQDMFWIPYSSSVAYRIQNESLEYIYVKGKERG